MVSTRVSTRKVNERPKRERRASTKFGNNDDGEEIKSDNKKRRSTSSSGNAEVATNGNNGVKNNDNTTKKKKVEKTTTAKAAAASPKKVENKKKTTGGGKRVDKQPIKAATTVKKQKKVSKTTAVAAKKASVVKTVKKKANDDDADNNNNSNLAEMKQEVKVRVRVENKLNKGYRTAIRVVNQTTMGKANNNKEKVTKKKVNCSDKGSSSSKKSTGKKDNAAVVTASASSGTRDKVIRVKIKLTTDIHVRVRVQKKLMKETDDKKYARVNEFHVGDVGGEGGKKKKQQALIAITKKKSPKITIRLNKKKENGSKDTTAAANDDDDDTDAASPSKKKTKTSHGNEIEPNRLCIIDGCERYKRARCGGHCLPHYEQLSEADKAEIAQQVEAKLAKVAPESKRCRGVECTKYKKSNHDGYCLTCYRKEYGEDAAPGIESGNNNNSPLPLPSEKTTTGDGGPPKEKKYCIFDGCMKHKQKGCFGYCLTHKAYANPEQHRLENELAAAESAMKKSTMRPSHFCKFEGCNKYKQSNCNGFCLQHVKSRVAYEDDDLEVVTKVRVRCDKRLHNGFCVAILSDANRAKLGLERPSPMSGDDEDMVSGDVDDEEMEDQDGDTTPAAEKSNGQPDFKISNKIRRKENGALLCKAVVCPKIAQTKQDGFCRNHFNRYMISTGQVESWECKCGEKIAVPSLRCGVCHRWRDGTNSPQKSPVVAASTASRPMTYVPEDANVQISDVTLKNARGRVLCKVIGCGKAEQAQNDGFCRTHFNEFAITGGMDEDLSEKWTCECGNEWSVRQKRCGNTRCQKWRGGKREAYTMHGTSGISTSNIIIQEGTWTCDNCGGEVETRKSRCGTCHRWKGGKRQGGWTLGSASNYDSDDGGIDRTQDWTCDNCQNGEVISASQARCGKCNRWRGGKRKPAPWECTKCNLTNPGGRNRCSGCLAWKAKTEPAKASKKASKMPQPQRAELPVVHVAPPPVQKTVANLPQPNQASSVPNFGTIDLTTLSYINYDFNQSYYESSNYSYLGGSVSSNYNPKESSEEKKDESEVL